MLKAKEIMEAAASKGRVTEAEAAKERAEARIEESRKEYESHVEEIVRRRAEEAVEGSTLVLALGTTGVEALDDRLVEIVLVTPNGRIHYQQAVRPEGEDQIFGSNFHGHTAESLAGSPTFAEIAEAYDSAARHHRILSWTGSFERAFIAAECARAGIIPATIAAPEANIGSERGSVRALATLVSGDEYARHESEDPSPLGVARKVAEHLRVYAKYEAPPEKPEVELNEEDFDDVPF